ANAPAANVAPGQMLLPVPPPEEERKPMVYRAGKLPKELPGWFKELDTEAEGQVALYQWKRSGRPIEDFLAMDRNNDGFLTVEEVLSFMAKNKDKAKQIAAGKAIVSKPAGAAEPGSAQPTSGRRGPDRAAAGASTPGNAP